MSPDISAKTCDILALSCDISDVSLNIKILSHITLVDIFQMYLLIFWITLTTFWPCLFHILAISFDYLAAFHDTLAVSHHILACSHAPSPAVSLYRMPWSCYIRRSTPFNYLGGDYGVSWFCQVLCFGWADTSVFLASILCFHFMLPRAAFVITLPVFAIA